MKDPKLNLKAITLSRDYSIVTAWLSIESQYNHLLEDGEGVWNFRGQASSDWPLKTSIQRAFEDYGIEPKNRLKREGVLTKEFKRYYHLYSSFIPDSDDSLTYF